jgi:Leucine-rich repeat (LRR) protein
LDMAEVELLAAAPLLDTLRELTARECDLGIGGFRRLVASPHLKHLTALRVPFNSIGAGAVATLHRATTLPALTELDLSEVGSYGRYGEDPIVDAGAMEELAAWPGLSRLRSLTLNGNDVSQEGLRALLRSPFVTGLKDLALRGNSLTPEAIAGFGDARSGLQLESLDLGENLLRNFGPRHLARSSCLGELKSLRIDRCEVSPHGAVDLAKAPFVRGLRRLDAGHNGFGPFGLLALLVAAPAELHTLRLADNDLGDDGVRKLVDSPASDSLRWLDLEQNGLTDAAAKALGGSPHLQNLLALRLTGNPIGKRAVTALKRSALGKRLALLEVPHESGPVDGDIPF